MDIDLDGIITGAIEESEQVETPEVEEVNEVEEDAPEEVEELEEESSDADENLDDEENLDDVEEDSSGEIEALENWSADKKEKFKAIPPENKEIVMDAMKELERGFNRKFEDLAEVRKRDEAFNNVFAPVKTQIDAIGLGPVEVTQNLVNAHQMLSTNPEQGIRDVITQYGGAKASEIVRGMAQELGLLNQDAPNGESDDYIDPQIKALQDELSDLKGGLTRTEQQKQQEQYTQHLNTVNLFKEAVDDSGNKKHPHFDRVEQSMADLIGAARARGQTLNLDDAYTSAVRMDPELFQQILADEKAELAKQQDAKRKQRVAASKKAARSPKESDVKASTVKPKKTLDDILNDVVPIN